MIKYTDKNGVAKIGEKLQANKTAIDGTLDTISELNDAVSEVKTVFSGSEIREALEEGYGTV